MVLVLVLPVAEEEAVLYCCTAVLVIIASVTRRTGSVFYNNNIPDGQKVPKPIPAALPEQQRRCVVVVVYIDR